ncbi:bifunctional adenosylcobinamide kinase/adenosylcobinamide-phosphate guanylyltransferase [Massilia sp. CF038]|uniref:bifunctional adenosylcobinamide kinase/adenosylcobinamide-phosphate guanylyltransferase n=1 Tax=Massilia sp. CF038 TaxID=1881045 RepID=UPI00091C5C91|nr:bifunctional adenosylcobinamide kinase/adenosylcobinamide-phosphate guanylyltransferase [Massilia sp. CF038]SHH73216.1 adenosylcobinamide kinase /adenosylcobinamide-phosphate guanylyltransferase [Massilia sp. CF038]
MSTTLVLGGARSGKSLYAERLAQASGHERFYLATACAGDAEMAQRIAHHRARREHGWTTIEEPIALAETIERHDSAGTVILIDCLTLWLTNLMFSDGRRYPETGTAELPALFHQQRQALLDVLAHARGDIILVSNEVGMGIVPMGAVSRIFTDEAGRLNQAVAAVCDHAVFIAAGLPLVLKGAPCLPA